MPFTSGIVSGLSRESVRSWRGEISFGPMLSITFERSRRRPSPSITPGFSERGTPLMIFAGHEYGTGSSRDWAARGTRLLGVRAVIAKSFERIHRSNLVMMGVLPCQFKEGTDAATLKLDGTETFYLSGFENGQTPRQDAKLTIHRANGKTDEVPLTLRIDTPIEVEYYRHGGILLYVLRQLLYRPDEREQKSPSP